MMQEIESGEKNILQQKINKEILEKRGKMIKK